MNVKHLFLSFIALWMAGCSPTEQPRHPLLLQAESCIDESCDSAYAYIYNLTDSFPHQADQALYGVLFTEILHKKGIHVGNDSLITASERFFSNNGKGRRWVKAMLHLGITKSRNGEIEEAVEWLKKAEQESLQLDDTLKYDVALALGDLNQQENCQVLAKRCYQDAYLLAQQTGSFSRQAHSLCKLIRTADKDSISNYIDSSKKLLPRVDKTLQSELLGCLGYWALQKDLQDQARQYLEKAIELFPNDFAALQLGNLFEKEGNTKKACELWFEALNTNEDEVRMVALEKLIPYYKNTETWRALDLSQLLNDLLKKHHSIDQTEHIAALQEQFDQNIIYTKLLKRLAFTLSIIALLALVILFFFGYHRKKMKQYNKVLSHIENLQKQLANQEKAQPLPKEWNLKEALHENNTVHRFHRLANKGKEPQLEDWTELSQITEQYAPGFSRFIHQNGMLSERDTHICLLIKLHFQPSEIAVLIGSSPQTVTNSRVRLLRKIFGELGGAKDFDEHIREME